MNLVHLVGFITKKFAMMHGHMKGKYVGTYTIVVEGGTMNEEGKTSVFNPVSISYVNMSSVRTIKHM